jgi:hypothetical protein
MRDHELHIFIDHWLIESRGDEFEVRESHDKTELTLKIKSKHPPKSKLESWQNAETRQH